MKNCHDGHVRSVILLLHYAQRTLNMTSSPYYACIMAGGSGERFWPMSRAQTPKHLLRLFSNRTLLEETVRRVEAVVPRSNLFVLTNTMQQPGIRAAMCDLLAAEQIIAEPAKRDTAP